jgi:hypothetical protein
LGKPAHLFQKPAHLLEKTCAGFLKGGETTFGASTDIREASTFISLFTPSFYCFTEPLYRLMLHDGLVSTEPLHRSALHGSLFRPSRSIFRHFTIICFDRAVLSFGASRSFVSTEPLYLPTLPDGLFLPSRFIVGRFTILSNLHELLSLARR